MRPAAPLLAVALFVALAAPAAASGGGSSAPAQQQEPASIQERLTSAETYMPMPAFQAGVLQRNINQGTIVVDMGLDIPDAALRRRAQLNAPRLRDALRTALANYSWVYYQCGGTTRLSSRVRCRRPSIECSARLGRACCSRTSSTSAHNPSKRHAPRQATGSIWRATPDAGIERNTCGGVSRATTSSLAPMIWRSTITNVSSAQLKR